MRYSIATDGSAVSAHFGRCPSYTLLDVVDGKVVSQEVISNPGHATGTIPLFMKEKGVEVMVAGGMGPRAVSYFDTYGIKTVLGVSGNIEDIIGEIIKGTISSGESSCQPGGGKDYGIPKEDGHVH